jgi:hypothetical protein
MDGMTLVLIYTVTGVDTSKIDRFRDEFSSKIQGREVRAHEGSGNLYFSTPGRDPSMPIGARTDWAKILGYICESGEPVTWTTEWVRDW